MHNRLAPHTAALDLSERALAFTRSAIATALARDNLSSVPRIAAQRWPGSRHLPDISKAAVPAGSTSDTIWASPLAQPGRVDGGFVEMLRPRTILGRLADARRVPFNVSVPAQTAGGSAGWAGEGKPVQASRLSFAGVTLPPTKIAVLVAMSESLLRHTDPAAEALIQADLIAATAEAADVALLDATAAGSPGTSPASILYGVAPIASTGVTVAAVTADLTAALTAIIGPNGSLGSPVWVMRPSAAIKLAALRDASGAAAFEDISVEGGTLLGVPVIVSNNAGARIVCLDAAELLVAEGGAEIDISAHATVELDDAPTAGARHLLSLWQTNMAATMIRLAVNWQARRAGAVAFITGGLA